MSFLEGQISPKASFPEGRILPLLPNQGIQSASHRQTSIATVPGSFQHFLGCSGDWQPDCLRSWLQDPDGDGLYGFSTRAIPAGSYEAKVAIGESWDVNYGDGGAPNGANLAFTVPQSCTEIFFQYDSVTHVLSIGAQGAPRGNLSKARAVFVSRDTIAWNPGAVDPAWTVALHAAPTGGLALSGAGVTGGTAIPLAYDPAGLSAAARAKYPHLAGYAAFKVPPAHQAEVPDCSRGSSRSPPPAPTARGSTPPACSCRARSTTSLPTAARWAPPSRGACRRCGCGRPRRAR